jgi:galactoside O-acetyltransferase
MKNDSFYSEAELGALGLQEYGETVLISRKASLYTPEYIRIGSNVRIDDFCILSGHITLHSNVHIAAYSALYGSNEIEMEDYTGVSPKTLIFSAMDDFSGEYLISPMPPAAFTKVNGGKVLIKRYAQLGAGTIVFPDLIINEGAAAGAMSLINRSLDAWSIYAGIPAKRIKTRSKNLLKFTNIHYPPPPPYINQGQAGKRLLFREAA